MPLAASSSNTAFQIMTNRFAPYEEAFTTNFYIGATGMSIARSPRRSCWPASLDGQAATFDDEIFIMRFTPRRARSLWSQINRARVAQLTSAGRLCDEGLRQMNAAKADGRWEAAYTSPSTMKTPTELAEALAADRKAAAAYWVLSKSRRYGYLLDITTRKKAVTRSRKIQLLVKLLGQPQNLHAPSPAGTERSGQVDDASCRCD